MDVILFKWLVSYNLTNLNEMFRNSKNASKPLLYKLIEFYFSFVFIAYNFKSPLLKTHYKASLLFASRLSLSVIWAYRSVETTCLCPKVWKQCRCQPRAKVKSIACVCWTE